MVVDVVTPLRKLVEGVQVKGLKLPSAKGELTILPGHAEMLTLLDTGVMSFLHDGAERKFAVSYGFGLAFGRSFSLDVMQDLTTALHQKNGLSAGDESSVRIRSTRLVGRLGFR